MGRVDATVLGSLRRLFRLIPPPDAPLEVADRLAGLRFASGAVVRFPPDFLRLTKAYGSGEFNEPDGHGMLVRPHNPRAPTYCRMIDWETHRAREMKEQEGEYRGFDIFPARTGLLQWGWAEGRKRYFWLTKGEPAKWPTLVYWDYKHMGQYDMPVAVFLERLLCGDLECRFIGSEAVPVRFAPARVSFLPSPEPAKG